MSLFDYCEKCGRKELLHQWHVTKNEWLTPKEISHFSKEKVWWRCEEGHVWQATPANRVYKRTGCPYCAGSKIWPGFNDLKSVCPKVAKEWHPTKNGTVTPEQVWPKSPLSVWWKCEKGHEWQEKIKSRTLQPECPRCRTLRLAAERKAKKEENKG